MPISDFTPEEIAEMQARGIDPRYATLSAPAPKGTSALGVIPTVAKAHAGQILGGGAGAIGGGTLAALAAPWLLGPEAGIPADLLMLGGGIGGALIGGAAGSKAQEAAQSPETTAAQQAALAQAQEEHPIATEASDIGLSALASGGMFSPTTTAKGVAGIIGKLAGKPLTKEAKNVLLQSAINPAISTGASLAQGQGIPPIKELIAQAAGGSLFAKSWVPSGRFKAPDEPGQEETNTERLGVTDYGRPEQDTPFTAMDEEGAYKIGNNNIKNLFLKRFAEVLPKTKPSGMSDDDFNIMKAEIRTRNDQLKGIDVNDMRQALHQSELNKTVEPINEQEDKDYLGGEMGSGESTWEWPKDNENIKQSDEGTTEGVSSTTPRTETQTEGGTPKQTPVFTQEILQKIIDKGATKPVSVQRIFPNLKLSEEDATEALRQADLLAELHINRPTEEGVQNATGIREDTGQPNKVREIGEGGKVGSSSNLVEKTPGSEESIPPQISNRLPEQEKGVVNSPLSDWNRYQTLVNELKVRPLKITEEEAFQKWQELEELKNKYGGKPPPQFPENRVLMPVELQHHIMSGKATTGSIMEALSKSPDHPFSELAKELLDTSDTKSLGVKWLHNPTLDLSNTRGERSHYDPRTDQVNIGTGSSGDARVVIEEAIHSMTAKKIPFFQGRGEEHYNRLNRYLKTGSNEAVKDLIRSYFQVAKEMGWHERLFKDKPEVQWAGDVAKGTAGYQDETQLSGMPYGMSNLDEFVAQAIKQPEFQRMLEGIKTEDNRNLWQKFVDSIRKILGLSPNANSLLNKVLRASQELVHQERPEMIPMGREINKPPVNRPPIEGESKSPAESNLPPDRYMGKIGSFTRSVIDRIRDIGSPIAKKLADHMQMAVDKETELKGQWKNMIVQAGEKLSPADKTRLMKAFNHELETGNSGRLILNNVAQRNFYDTARRLLRDSGLYRLSIGEPVTQVISKNGRNIYVQRNLRQDPLYWPGMAKQNVLDIYRKNIDQAKIAELDKTFDEYNRKLGLDKASSAERIQNFKDSLQSNKFNQSRQDYFNANRKAQGTPLPPEFRETDPVRNLEKYFNRAAVDSSHYEFMEKDPEILGALGESKDAWGKVIPPTPDKQLANNPVVKAGLEHWVGEPRNPQEENERHFSSLLSSGFIAGPSLEIHKVVSNVVKAMVQAPNPAVLVKAVTHGMSNIMKGYQHALEHGVVKHVTAGSVHQMFSGAYNAAEKMQIMGRLIRRVATLNDLTTKFNSGLVQSMNEIIIPSKLLRANHGDVTQQKFIRRLDPTYIPGKQYDEAGIQQLAARYTGYIHGTGDIRSLPEWMLKDTEVSGFFSLAHWSVSQTNNFMKEVYEPATRGELMPLFTGLFGAAVGGYLIKELRQDISGKKNPIPSLQEIASSDRGLSGNQGLLLYNLIAATQYAGFGGLISQVAKYPLDFVYKNKPMGATFPLDEIVTDSATTLRYISEAIANDPNVNWGTLTQAWVMHMLSTNIQMSRIAINQGINNGLITGLPAEKKFLSDKTQQLRRFDQAEGLPYSPMDTGEENPYMNLEQKRFKMEQDIPTAIKQLPQLVSNIIQTYGDKPDVMMNKLRALKENQYSTFPSMEQMPLSFYKYLGYLNRMEGPEAANQELMDYMHHKIINQVKGSVVP